MTDRRAKSDSRLRRIEESLVQLFGAGQFPLPLVGDLDDLLFTLDEIASQIQTLTKLHEDGDLDALRASFSKLEILLDHDLPMILEDVVPPMKELSQRLPDSSEDTDRGRVS